MKEKILIVEDDINTLNGLAEILEEENLEICKAKNARMALGEFNKGAFDLVLMDYLLPDQNGLELSGVLLENQPDIKIIMMTAFGTVKNAVNAMKMGIYDYLTKPINLDELLIIIRRALEEKRLISENLDLKSKLTRTYRFENIIGVSGKMQEVFQKIAKVAATDATVLLRGESGTGKELIARAVHFQSKRQNHAMVEINCASIPENLLESELFGHEKGAFTGAYKMKKGKFEIADKGTLFLDEIGELPLSLQAKLLRVLQEKRFNRVGGVDNIEVDVRLIAATNADLEKRMAEKLFREDLYYRLNVIPILIPPLRERLEDIGPLTDHFLKKYVLKDQRQIQGISEEARKLLMGYDWPGNVRELENAIENAVVMCEGTHIAAQDLPAYLQGPRATGSPLFDRVLEDSNLGYKEKLEACEREIIRQALSETGNNKTQAARKMGFTLRTLRNKVKKYNL
ncbi:MAG: sigma-54-dependent Fis family transcriptional regulator [Calditrichaceae bacterium]|nr:sigma-54 dependent transcriptional regulator [Calditrichia bacterium]NUQ40184.1 sigma-54-dependent Fis family transcriptional regulator [Calditrichaceae bacterium]